MPDTSRPDDKLRILRTQLGQTNAWQTAMVEIIERLDHENRTMKRVIIGMKSDIDAMKAEKNLCT